MSYVCLLFHLWDIDLGLCEGVSGKKRTIFECLKICVQTNGCEFIYFHSFFNVSKNIFSTPYFLSINVFLFFVTMFLYYKQSGWVLKKDVLISILVYFSD